MRRASWGLDLEKIDAQQIQELLGEESYQLWNQIKSIPRLLEIKGYIEKLGAKYELTPKGMRKIGQRALAGYLRLPGPGRPGEPPDPVQGQRVQLPPGGLQTVPVRGPLSPEPEPHPDEFPRAADPDLPPGRKTAACWNSQPEDFEVYQTEKRTRSSVVLMLDMSGSMARDEKFFAAKKVALALHTLIHTQFPHDRLHLVGFSSYARALQEQGPCPVSTGTWTTPTPTWKKGSSWPNPS